MTEKIQLTLDQALANISVALGQFKGTIGECEAVVESFKIIKEKCLEQPEEVK